MSLKLYLFFLSFAFVVGVSSADIFGDFFKWDIVSSAFSGAGEPEDKKAKRDDGDDEDDDDDDGSVSTCDCHGAKCNCCVDFNISNVIDLGGPGCVVMRYLSESEGISLNVSYGTRVLHSQKVVDEKKQGACMPLLSDFAQFCARFSGLKKANDEMTGCLNFEPTVLGEATTQYFVGCFRMTPDEMILDNSLRNATESESDGHETSTKKPEDESQSFLEAVNQSAQESFEFFSSLLGIDVGGGGKKKNKTNQTEKEPETTAETPAASRNGKFRTPLTLN